MYRLNSQDINSKKLHESLICVIYVILCQNTFNLDSCTILIIAKNEFKRQYTEMVFPCTFNYCQFNKKQISGSVKSIIEFSAGVSLIITCKNSLVNPLMHNVPKWSVTL